jgi:hypothetical protein
MLYLKSAELTFGLSPMAPVDRQSVLRFLTHELLRQEWGETGLRLTQETSISACLPGAGRMLFALKRKC